MARVIDADQYSLFADDCLNALDLIKDASIDLVAADPPYATTENSWDSLIPFEPLWKQLRRIIKPKGAIVMTASQPFTTKLIMSAPDLFKYELIWVKTRPTGHVHAKNKPMKRHENVLVFSKGTTVHASQSPTRMNYYPVGVRKHEGSVSYKTTKPSQTVMGARSTDKDKPPMQEQEASGYPDSILQFASEAQSIHPTQKPVGLFSYIIRSYTQPGDVVLDFCMGSGTTGVAALNLDRRFVGMESDDAYFKIARQRIEGTGSAFDKHTRSNADCGVIRPAPAIVRQRRNRELTGNNRESQGSGNRFLRREARARSKTDPVNAVSPARIGAFRGPFQPI